MTIQRITHFSIYVKNIDECLHWYREKLGFVVCDDNNSLDSNNRWLTISPCRNRSTQFVLMLARTKKEERCIGNNGMCVLTTDNCYSDCELFSVRGMEIVKQPETLPWGISAIVKDLYGNLYNIVELNGH